MNLPASLQGESRTRLLQGAAVGCVATLVIGFAWGGWQLQSRVEARTATAVREALVAALTPICVANFNGASDAPVKLAALKATDSWKQDDFVAKGGWATFPGKDKPNDEVASACARVLNK